MAEPVADGEAALAAVLRPADFCAESTSSGGATSVRLEGELDMATSSQLSGILRSALEGRPTRLTVDLRGLTFIDSTGIRVLVAASRRAQGCGSSFVLLSPGRAVLKALRLTGFDQLVTIELEESVD
jgi:anti-sigma B factor antagonist